MWREDWEIGVGLGEVIFDLVKHRLDLGQKKMKSMSNPKSIVGSIRVSFLIFLIIFDKLPNDIYIYAIL